MRPGPVVLFLLTGCTLAEPTAELLRPPRGVLRTNVEFEPAATEVYARGRDVPLHDLPIARWLVLPMTGVGDIHVDLTLPTGDFREARGVIELACRNCALGDDEAKLAFPVFDREGSVDFGHLTFSRLDARFEVRRGTVAIDRWTVESPDIRVQLTGNIVLAERWADSELDGCVKFKPSEALRSRDPKLYDLVLLTGAARGDDGFDYIRVTGTVGASKLQPKVCR